MTLVRFPVRATLAGALLPMLSACAVGPDFHTPAAPPEMGYTAQPMTTTAAPQAPVAAGAQSFTIDAAIATDWWTAFKSPTLDALIARALAANSDFAAANAAVKVARETWLAQRGILVPQIDGGANSSRSRSSQYLSPVLNAQQFDYSLQTAQVTVGYALDLFGGNRRQVETARAQYQQQRYLAAAARITLINTVAAAALQEASLRAQIAVQQQIIAIETQQLGVERRQQSQGQIAGADVLAQAAALAAARSVLSPLQKALAQQQDLLAYLTGQSPADGPIVGIDFASLALPRALPFSLPATLVRQRPDVRAAEEALHAASAQVGVAIAARLPQITLSASAGGASGNLASLFAGPNTLWSVGGGIAQPIFAGGTLLHKQRAAEAALDQAKAQYRSAVLTAFQNVADTLQALHIDADALDAAQTAQHSAADSMTIATRQYRDGQVSSLSVLSAEQTLRQAESGLVQAEAARFADTAALFQALGGGWWDLGK